MELGDLKSNMLWDISDIYTEEYVIVVSNRKNMGTVLVTGGAGFIGTNLAKHALNRGWNVKLLIIFPQGFKEILTK